MITVRKAGLADAKDLTNILIESWQAAFVGIMSDEMIKNCTVPENCEKMMEDILCSERGTFYLGLLDEKPCGELFWCANEGENSAEILALHSIKESWGTGLGKALVEQAITDIKESGMKSLYLWAFKENKRACKFYEKCGFTHSGEERVSDFDGAIEVKYTYQMGVYPKSSYGTDWGYRGRMEREKSISNKQI